MYLGIPSQGSEGSSSSNCRRKLGHQGSPEHLPSPKSPPPASVSLLLSSLPLVHSRGVAWLCGRVCTWHAGFVSWVSPHQALGTPRALSVFAQLPGRC